MIGDDPPPLDQQLNKIIQLQINFIGDKVVPALLKEIDINDLIERGQELQVLVADTVEQLLRKSNDATLECRQNNPSIIGDALFDTQCFRNISNLIGTTLEGLKPEAIKYLEENHIKFSEGSIPRIVELMRDTMIESIENMARSELAPTQWIVFRHQHPFQQPFQNQ